jgi:hypothetical protein
MSDQSYEATPALVVDGSTLINVAGGSGITQINGDATPHQFIAAVSPLAVVDAANIHTLSVSTFTPVARGVVPASGGGGVNFLRADGSWVPPAGAGVTSINGDGTPAQIIAGTLPISIVDAPGNTHTVNVATFGAAARGVVPASGGGTVNFLRADGSWTPPSGAGITAINGDNTALQTLSPAANSGMVITNPGAGAHTIKGPTSNRVSNGGGATPLPNGVLTVVTGPITIPAASSGFWWIFCSAGLHGIAGQLMDAVIRQNGIVLGQSGFAGIVETAGQTLEVTGHTGTLIFANVGDTFDVAINHHGGGAATTSLVCTIDGFQVSG